MWYTGDICTESSLLSWARKVGLHPLINDYFRSLLKTNKTPITKFMYIIWARNPLLCWKFSDSSQAVHYFAVKMRNCPSFLVIKNLLAPLTFVTRVLFFEKNSKIKIVSVGCISSWISFFGFFSESNKNLVTKFMYIKGQGIQLQHWNFRDSSQPVCHLWGTAWISHFF